MRAGLRCGRLLPGVGFPGLGVLAGRYDRGGHRGRRWHHGICGCRRQEAGIAGIAITRQELTATELRAAAGKTRDARAARRMLAIALVLEGADRTTAAQTCGMDRQTLRDWVHRHNAEGLAGLVNRAVAQRPRRLVPEQLATLAAWVEAGPDRSRDGVVRWRHRDLQARIQAAFGVTLHERTVGKQLAALGFRRLSVRPGTRSRSRQRKTRSKKLPRSGCDSDPRAGTGQAAGDLVPGVGRARKRSGGRFSRRTRAWVSREPSPASGPGAAQDPARPATPAINRRSPVLSNRWRLPAH